MMRSGKDAERAESAAAAGAEPEAKRQRQPAGGGIALQLATGATAAMLPLAEGEGFEGYAAVATTWNDDMNPDEPVPLPPFAALSLVLPLAQWVTRERRRLSHPDEQGEEQEAAWRAEFKAAAAADAPTLCATLQLALYLGVDGLQEFLVAALVERCASVEQVAAFLGEGAEDEAALARVGALMSFSLRRR